MSLITPTRLVRLVRLTLKLGQSFLTDVRGVTAVWFAILAVVLITLVLGAIDVERLVVERVRLQDSLDAATLFAARAGTLNNANLTAIGNQAMAEELQGVAGFASTPTYAFTNTSNNTVTGTAHAIVDPIILGLFSNDQLVVDVTTVVTRTQTNPVELVLVLDTTGSMTGAKLAGLKTAATNLVTTMTSDPQAAVKLGVVPFAQYVNTGVANRNQTWMNVPADWVQNVTPGCTTATTRTVCQTQTYSCTQYNDGVAYQTTCSRSINCVTTPLNPPVTSCPAPYTVSHRYYGCTGSPPYPKNVTDSDPSRVYPGYLDLTCAAPLTPLTSDPAVVKAAINALTANGETYIPAGLAWGFNVISAPVPFTEADAYDPTGQNQKPRKALVLMTDGENTKLMNVVNGRHDVSPPGNSPAFQADTYTAELCANIKAQHIEVFTVAFQVPSQAAKDMLSACATDGAHYFDASDTTALNAAFDSIAKSMHTLSISH